MKSAGNRVHCARHVRFAAGWPVGQRIQAVDFAAAAEGDQRHFLRFARLEANGGAGRNVEVHAERRRPVEIEGAIGLEEVVVAANLDRVLLRFAVPCRFL